MGCQRYKQEKSKKTELRDCPSKAKEMLFERLGPDAIEMRHEKPPGDRQNFADCWVTLMGSRGLRPMTFRARIIPAGYIGTWSHAFAQRRELLGYFCAKR
jgi:hypothetical protein